jgi:hypothetical protein
MIDGMRPPVRRGRSRSRPGSERATCTMILSPSGMSARDHLIESGLRKSRFINEHPSRVQEMASNVDSNLDHQPNSRCKARRIPHEMNQYRSADETYSYNVRP